MASQNPNQNSSLYPQIIRSKPDPLFTSSSPSSNLYPKIDPEDLVENLFPGHDHSQHEYPPAQSHAHPPASAPPEVVEEVLLKIAGAIVNLIDKNYSVELASGDLYIIRLCQGNNVVAVLARVDDEIQWPLAKDEAAVKLDDSHYFFSLRLPRENYSSDSSDEEDHKREKRGDGENMLSYGLTIASKGQERLLLEFDQILESYSCFSAQKVSENAKELLDGNAAKGDFPNGYEVRRGEKGDYGGEMCCLLDYIGS
ncbi:SPARTIN [Salix purpurea]|uniref:SPARTIN n=1 Tax=Salix purpurea TaxID=77065 RepID=A0A9Q1AKI5_SALPP|nr:SPARTIN [Salix purpurea]